MRSGPDRRRSEARHDTSVLQLVLRAEGSLRAGSRRRASRSRRPGAAAASRGTPRLPSSTMRGAVLGRQPRRPPRCRSATIGPSRGNLRGGATRDRGGRRGDVRVERGSANACSPHSSVFDVAAPERVGVGGERLPEPARAPAAAPPSRSSDPRSRRAASTIVWRREISRLLVAYEVVGRHPHVLLGHSRDRSQRTSRSKRGGAASRPLLRRCRATRSGAPRARSAAPHAVPGRRLRRSRATIATTAKREATRQARADVVESRARCVTAAARRSPSGMPSAAPISAVMMDSCRIIRRVCRRVRPTARSIPISRVRSNTARASVLTIPKRLTTMVRPRRTYSRLRIDLLGPWRGRDELRHGEQARVGVLFRRLSSAAGLSSGGTCRGRAATRSCVERLLRDQHVARAGCRASPGRRSRRRRAPPSCRPA